VATSTVVELYSAGRYTPSAAGRYSYDRLVSRDEVLWDEAGDRWWCVGASLEEPTRETSQEMWFCDWPELGDLD
jgi:hypothetical protein